ncbi:MBL fold metallo-hydrolase [Candidatus Uhrbacteria bacterium]|nr:MBL fold metallo-hydrolase [Candidatus Uhrbacteria bacterium]
MTSHIHRATPLKAASPSTKFLVLGLFFCLLLTLYLFQPLTAFFVPGLRVWFFDIGQGDGILILTPHGEQIVVDGGPDQTILRKLPQVMWPWDHHIDTVVITHPDADHITGSVGVLERYEVKNIFETGVRGGTQVIDEFARAEAEEGASVRLVRKGDSFVFDGVSLDILWPTDQAVVTKKDRNDTSVVVRVRYGQTSLLLTGDATSAIEPDFARAVGDVDVLKAGHHGSKTSTSVTFLQQIKPEVAIISDGVNNRYGHPHPIVLSRLKQAGVQVWRTDLDGDIEIFSDGHTITTRPRFLPF